MGFPLRLSLGNSFKNNSILFQNDRLYDDLITSQWYLFPNECQNALILLLNSAKYPNSFKVAGVLPLNMNTYIKVIFQNDSNFD